MSRCEQCDDHTPSMGTMADDARDLHRAMHDLGRAIVADWPTLTAYLGIVWLVIVGAAVIDYML